MGSPGRGQDRRPRGHGPRARRARPHRRDRRRPRDRARRRPPAARRAFPPPPSPPARPATSTRRWSTSALHDFPWRELDYLFVENVGNLVCPAIYDLGQAVNVVALSVTEGEDKPLKYPVMFRKADLVLLTKVDLLPHLDFDRGRARGRARARHAAARRSSRSRPAPARESRSGLAWLAGRRGRHPPRVVRRHGLSPTTALSRLTWSSEPGRRSNSPRHGHERPEGRSASPATARPAHAAPPDHRLRGAPRGRGRATRGQEKYARRPREDPRGGAQGPRDGGRGGPAHAGARRAGGLPRARAGASTRRRARSRPGREPAASRIDAAPPGRPLDPAAVRLLVVDDNELNRDMLSRRLGAGASRWRSREDGERALDRLEQQGFDLVLLDVMMPGLSGLDVLKRVRERWPESDLPVIMATARDATEDVVEALRLGRERLRDEAARLPGGARADRDAARRSGGRSRRSGGSPTTSSCATASSSALFGRYLSDEVVSGLLASPEGPRLGGEAAAGHAADVGPARLHPPHRGAPSRAGAAPPELLPRGDGRRDPGPPGDDRRVRGRRHPRDLRCAPRAPRRRAARGRLRGGDAVAPCRRSTAATRRRGCRASRWGSPSTPAT